MKTGAIILCRTSSSRFPNKILKKIHDDISLLEYVIQSISLCDAVDEVIIATTQSVHSKEIELICERRGAKIYYGSEHNVYDRFSSAALEYNLDIVARINADCPFILPKLVDYCFRTARRSSADYVATILHETFPIGQHVEILKANVFAKIDQSILSDQELEHVTPYIYNHPEIFSLKSVSYMEDVSNIRLTIDYPEDLEFCKKFVKNIDITINTSVKELVSAYNDLINVLDYVPINKSQNMLLTNTSTDVEVFIE